MHNRFCRICWNILGWRKPSGASIETAASSYVAKHRFGHEEWLFNYEWLIDGFQYGHLQPIGKYLNRYAGNHCAIMLYTITPDKSVLLVGKISDVYVPTEPELKRVLDTYTERNWLGQMREQVKKVGGSPGDLENPTPQAIANVRFRPEDVSLFDPHPRVVGEHTITRHRRYHPYYWTDNDPLTDVKPPAYIRNDPRRSERERIRAAQKASIVDPQHTRLQNRLYDYLCSLYGAEHIHYERNHVDLAVTMPEGEVYFEIKIEASAKRCIRLALGQLLEYAHYPDDSRAVRFVVVGDAPLNQEEQTYLVHLREQYQIPVYYSRFDWEKNKLGAEY
ncbi:hypothetical protein F4X86_04025 [Candidatus Saccharibacteria bacterium]|nr:hypothetical protein [Candidatus Saccharibacteria bacterium]